MSALYLDDDQARRLAPIGKLIPAMRRALVDLSAGRVLQPLRTVIEIPPPGALLFMKPVLAGGVLATKLITQMPGNAERGLPTMLATLVLMDAATGRTLAVMDATALTALRTAAVSAVAADALAPCNAAVVALIGSGTLARTHAAALRAVRPIREVRIWSRDPANVARCAAEVGGIAVPSAEAAVRGADIVCTVTTSSTPVLRGEWLASGTFVAAVGAPRPDWRELDDEAMRNVLVVESREAAARESGDVRLSGAKPFAELGEIFAGGRRLPEGATIIFKSLGQAVEDAYAAELVYRAALERHADC